MSVCKKTPVYAVFFVCVLFFSCDKNGIAQKIKAADGVPVITKQPKSASYLENDETEILTVNASVKGEYTLSYQWYLMKNYLDNIIMTRNPSDQQISVEVNKLMNDDIENSQFRKAGYETPVCGVTSWNTGRNVYICVITSTSKDGSKTFKAFSDIAVITIVRQPLTYWYEVDKSYLYNIDIKNITYGNGYFVAVCSYDIAYSSDGRTWSFVEDATFYERKSSINAVAYGNDRFVAVGAKGKIAYSTDIKTWIPVESAVSESFHDIIYGNGIFVASFRSGLAYSSNGETWFPVKDFDETLITCIAYGNGRFIAGGLEGRIYISDNGKIWTTLNDSTFKSQVIRTIAYGHGRFIAVTYGDDSCDSEGDNYIMGYSDDGEIWNNNPFIYHPIKGGIEKNLL